MYDNTSRQQSEHNTQLHGSVNFILHSASLSEMQLPVEIRVVGLGPTSSSARLNRRKQLDTLLPSLSVTQ